MYCHKLSSFNMDQIITWIASYLMLCIFMSWNVTNVGE